MLEAVGVSGLEELFSVVPEDCRRKEAMNLPEPVSEWELNELMAAFAESMAVHPKYNVFIGAGSYEHFIPESVSYLLGRSEFVTSYTPYQPEMSQGTLQAIYEYQTLVSRLLGMDVTNASLYDGASALAEALLMALHLTKRKRVALSGLIHPHYRRVVQTYLEPTDYEITVLPFLEDGRTDLSSVDGMEDLAAIAVQSPNFFGCMEDLKRTAETAQVKEALFLTCFTEPLAYGLFKNPGCHDADIVCGEGQSFGIPQSYGGPGLGMFASKMKYVRSMPGRLVGQTLDKQGRRGFVLTLATREQHIRREKATSNICTNSSLCALAAAIYMASLGGTGIRKLARLNYDKAEYLKKGLKGAGFKIRFDSPSFNEFVGLSPPRFKATYRNLLEKGIVAGLPLATYYPELENHYLFCVTETKTREDMDLLIKEIKA
jgi:glycine dehydrogenase subunit 1